tara:strand:+ start:950 stop:2275 length:1326 start_codon:yes stop_codon:yes gene_type:complete
MKKLSEELGKLELGQGGTNTKDGTIRADEFLSDLKGKRAIRKFREMRDNDSTIGSIMYATEQVLRDVEYHLEPANDSDEAKKEADFVKSILEDMEHSVDDHVSEALSHLTFGFSVFEVVYKRRRGPDFRAGKKYSKHSDGRIGVRKLASRAQWTIERFDVDKTTGDVLGIRQEQNYGSKSIFIPANKVLHYKTTNTNNDPSGRSILRNAYTSYQYLKNLQNIEAIAVERELHGVPIGRISAEYLSPDATSDQVSVRSQMEKILRDLKFNEQGYALLPSDVYRDADGKPTNQRIVDIELITSNGTRNIDINPIVNRYQHDIARSVMAEFLMLGAGANGSYALSKSKTDLFLRSMESYINSIFDVLNKQLVEPLWHMNGLNFDLMPKICAGDVAPHDLRELGSYLRNLNGANIDLSDQDDIVNALLANAELPPIKVSENNGNT